MNLTAEFSFANFFVSSRLENLFTLRCSKHYRTKRHFHIVRRVLYSTPLRRVWRYARAITRLMYCSLLNKEKSIKVAIKDMRSIPGVFLTDFV